MLSGTLAAEGVPNVECLLPVTDLLAQALNLIVTEEGFNKLIFSEYNISCINIRMVNSDTEVQVLKNGGKSQPSSPITLTAPGSKVPGSESSEDEREGQIRVGKDYQAVPPPFIQKSDRRADQCPERALLVWSPSNTISNQKCKESLIISWIHYNECNSGKQLI